MLRTIMLPFIVAAVVANVACLAMEKGPGESMNDSTESTLVQASEVPSFEKIGREKFFRFDLPDGGHCKATHSNDGITDIFRVERYTFIKGEKEATVQRANSRAQFELIAGSVKNKKMEHALSNRLKQMGINTSQEVLPENEEPEFYTNT